MPEQTKKVELTNVQRELIWKALREYRDNAHELEALDVDELLPLFEA